MKFYIHKHDVTAEAFGRENIRCITPNLTNVLLALQGLRIPMFYSKFGNCYYNNDPTYYWDNNVLRKK